MMRILPVLLATALMAPAIAAPDTQRCPHHIAFHHFRHVLIFRGKYTPPGCHWFGQRKESMLCF
jgi:hypothetical protein